MSGVSHIASALLLSHFCFISCVQVLVEFEPPEVTFTFSFMQSFVIFTPPLVELEIGFDFSASVKAGFVLDTVGIRQAVEQDEPSKALNSFALKDTFNGVDLPLARIRGGVTVGVSASAVIVKASGTYFDCFRIVIFGRELKPNRRIWPICSKRGSRLRAGH